MDGPVAEAAIRALEESDVDLILPYVHESGEDEVRRALEEAGATRAIPEAHDLADLWFVETVVRVHRAGKARHTRASGRPVSTWAR